MANHVSQASLQLRRSGISQEVSVHNAPYSCHVEQSAAISMFSQKSFKRGVETSRERLDNPGRVREFARFRRSPAWMLLRRFSAIFWDTALGEFPESAFPG
jgi:hypothetical protein